jgi:hypothetical protein
MVLSSDTIGRACESGKVGARAYLCVVKSSFAETLADGWTAEKHRYIALAQANIHSVEEAAYVRRLLLAIAEPGDNAAKLDQLRQQVATTGKTSDERIVDARRYINRQIADLLGELLGELDDLRDDFDRAQLPHLLARALCAREGGEVWPADQVERWPIDRLIPYAKNSRTHSKAQIAQLAASMKEWGWTNPVLADEAGGCPSESLLLSRPEPILGFVKHRFALHTRYRVGERDSGIHAAVENRAAPFPGS